jgi:hypothetical protein
MLSPQTILLTPSPSTTTQGRSKTDGNGYRELSQTEDERYEAADALLVELEPLGVEFRPVEGKVRFKPASRVDEAGKAALRHYKAEVYELLREEEECTARRDAHLASQPKTDPLPDDEWEEFEKLTGGRQDALCGWISQTLIIDPESRPASLQTSYHLKHVFERSPEGFYVTDAQFMTAMWMSGFLGRRYPGKRYEDLETRYYYLRPNREGFVDKLVEHAGMPQAWAWEAIMEAREEERREGKEL